MASWCTYSHRGPVSVTYSSARAPASLISLGPHLKTLSATCQSHTLPLSSDWATLQFHYPKAETVLHVPDSPQVNTCCWEHTWPSHVCGLTLMHLGRRSSCRMDWARVRQEGLAGRSALNQQCCLGRTGCVMEMWELWPGTGDSQEAPQESGSGNGTVKKPVTETSSLACQNSWKEAQKEKKWGENGWSRNCGAKEIMGWGWSEGIR